MSRIARSCEIYKFYDFSQFLQDNDFSAVCCEIYEFLHLFVMLINSQPQSQLADFTKFAEIAKNRQLNDFSAVCCEIYEFLHFFVMLINSQPHSQLVDFTKFAEIAKNRQLNDFSAVCCEIYEFLHFFVMLINPQPESRGLRISQNLRNSVISSSSQSYLVRCYVAYCLLSRNERRTAYMNVYLVL